MTTTIEGDHTTAEVYLDEDDPRRASYHFDTGLREQLDDNTIWHGMGWVTETGAVRLPIDRENSVWINPDGTTRFYNDAT